MVLVATFVEAWRVITDKAVLGDTAIQGARIVKALEDAEAVCLRVFQDCGEGVPEVEESYDRVRSVLQGVVAGCSWLRSGCGTWPDKGVRDGVGRVGAARGGGDRLGR